MATSKDVLAAVNLLNVKLYGENGFEGDIPEIKKSCKETKEHFEDHSKRITQLEVIRSGLSKKVVAGGISTIVTIIALVILAVLERLPD